MTVLPSFGRTLSQRLVTRAHCVSTSQLRSNLLLRVVSAQTPPTSHIKFLGRIARDLRCLCATRTYATESAAANKAAPKAKRVTKPKSTRAPKKAAPKKKSTKTAPKKKPAKKSKSKSKAKAKRKELTAVQKARLAKRKENKAKKDQNAKRKAQREISLIGKEPKGLPQTAWMVVVKESSSKGTSAAAGIKSISQKYQSLSPGEKENYNHIANENKAANEAAFKKWISSFTPDQIREANKARKSLSRTPGNASKKRRSPQLIKDDRLVTQPRSAYIYFSKERYASGDFKSLTLAECSKLIGREWRALSASDKKPYEDQAAQEKARYITEYKTVYGKDLVLATRSAKPKTSKS